MKCKLCEVTLVKQIGSRRHGPYYLCNVHYNEWMNWCSRVTRPMNVWKNWDEEFEKFIKSKEVNLK